MALLISLITFKLLLDLLKARLRSFELKTKTYHPTLWGQTSSFGGLWQNDANTEF